MTTMLGEELMGARGDAAEGAARTRWTSRGDMLAKATVLLVAFGLLMALWTILWVPSAPVP